MNPSEPPFFISVANQVLGPFAPVEILRLFAKNQVTRDTLVCYDSQNWLPVHSVVAIGFRPAVLDAIAAFQAAAAQQNMTIVEMEASNVLPYPAPTAAALTPAATAVAVAAPPAPVDPVPVPIAAPVPRVAPQAVPQAMAAPMPQAVPRVAPQAPRVAAFVPQTALQIPPAAEVAPAPTPRVATPRAATPQIVSEERSNETDASVNHSVVQESPAPSEESVQSFSMPVSHSTPPFAIPAPSLDLPVAPLAPVAPVVRVPRVAPHASTPPPSPRIASPRVVS